jgi:oligoribonuclease (3'-5' exoribonuclease)
MSNYLVAMDSETGGLSAKNADILTLFMSIVDEDFKTVAELDLKLKPNDRLPIVEDGAMKVNKIDLQKHLADPNTVTYKEAKDRILAFIKPYLKKVGRHSNLVPLGQNLIFDLKFIWEYIITEEEWQSSFSYNIEDTKTACLFLKRCGWLPADTGTLKSLVEFFNIAKREAHEARADVLMTLDVYRAMIALMESKKNSGNSQDLISLLETE